MLEDEREKIIRELKVVDEVILSIDKDLTVIKTIEKIHYKYSKDYNLFLLMEVIRIVKVFRVKKQGVGYCFNRWSWR